MWFAALMDVDWWSWVLIAAHCGCKADKMKLLDNGDSSSGAMVLPEKHPSKDQESGANATHNFVFLVGVSWMQ